MKEEIIKQIGSETGLKGNQLNVFVEFFSQRFPNESSKITGYCKEWAQRFLRGSPENCMDAGSLRIYREIKKGDEI